MLVRLQKFLADAGVASRRASEAIIVAGRVEVNGSIARELGVKVDALHDRVTVDGKPLKPRRKMYVVLHKPPGYVCSRADSQKRPLIAELLPKEWQDVYPVGRLDLDSEGLIFLTNDGEFCLRITHPRYGVRKKYVALVAGRVSLTDLTKLTKGVVHLGDNLKAEKARLISSNASHSVVEIELAEGKNREVRRLFETLGFNVDRLQRVQIGPIKLGELPQGKWRVLTKPELDRLLQVGTVAPSPAQGDVDRRSHKPSNP